MVRKLFPAVISGVLLSAVLAAAMSTADSQLLAAASAFASDVYGPIFRKNNATDKEMLWAGRWVVLVIAVVAMLIAANPNAGSIMSLVSNAWGVFGAAFGPVILLSLFWKRFTFSGAVAGIVVGALVDILWLAFLASTGVYEILPGAVAGLIAAVVVSLVTKAPSKEVTDLFDAYRDAEALPAVLPLRGLLRRVFGPADQGDLLVGLSDEVEIPAEVQRLHRRHFADREVKGQRFQFHRLLRSPLLPRQRIALPDGRKERRVRDAVIQYEGVPAVFVHVPGREMMGSGEHFLPTLPVHAQDQDLLDLVGVQSQLPARHREDQAIPLFVVPPAL